MPKQQTEFLIDLIRSMSRSEKRQFRLFSNARGDNEEKLFVQLFDYIEGTKVYDEQDLLIKVPAIKKSQLANIKANLYRHLLYSLRHVNRDQSEIAIREMMDYAGILLDKGMPKAALEMLEKAGKNADDIHHSGLAYAAVEAEREIESQYITGSTPARAFLIKDKSNELAQHIQVNNQLANLSLLLYGLYLKYGYVKDKKEFEFIKDFFHTHLPSFHLENLNFEGRMYYYQSLVWYCHMVQDFANYYKYAQKWVDLFEEDEAMKTQHFPLYLKALHNALNALYMAFKPQKFNDGFDKFLLLEVKVMERGKLNEMSTYALFQAMHLLNKIILWAEYDQGVKMLEPLENKLKLNPYHWDESRLIVLYYKIACVYFGADDFGKALVYLNKIINLPLSPLRTDIQSFARILSLIAHFELGNETLVKYQIMAVYKFLSRQEDLQQVQKEIFHFLKRTPKILPRDVKKEFIKLREALMKLTKDPYERRPFLYLDIIAWLDSKIEKRRIQDIIKERKESVL